MKETPCVVKRVNCGVNVKIINILLFIIVASFACIICRIREVYVDVKAFVIRRYAINKISCSVCLQVTFLQLLSITYHADLHGVI